MFRPRKEVLMFGLSTRTWIIGGVVAAIIGTGAVASRIKSHSVEDRVDFATYMITKKLSLNDDQEASLDKLAASWIGTAGSMKTFRKSMIDEIKGLTNGEDLSVEQLNALRDKIKAEIDQKTQNAKDALHFQPIAEVVFSVLNGNPAYPDNNTLKKWVSNHQGEPDLNSSHNSPTPLASFLGKIVSPMGFFRK